MCRRAAVFAHRILRGERPAEIPVEEPSKVEFLINLKTARLLGISLPPAVLAIANGVVE